MLVFGCLVLLVRLDNWHLCLFGCLLGDVWLREMSLGTNSKLVQVVQEVVWIKITHQ